MRDFRGFRREEERTLDRIFLDQLYREAKRWREGLSIKMEDFVDLYGVERVREDLERVERRKKYFEQIDAGMPAEVLKLGIAFEGMIIERGVNKEDRLFGPNSLVKGTSLYDDFFGGVDAVVEFWEKKEDLYSHLGLAVDVTTGRELEGKLGQVLEDVRKGNFARVKYFSSQRMNFRGELSRIPRVVIAADPATVKDFGQIWLSSRMNPTFQERVRSHFLNFQILREIILELEAWIDYARKNRRPEEEISLYRRTLERAREVYRRRVSLFEEKASQEIDQRDASFETLAYYLESVQR
ncbi:MAG: hypothetical protein KatS3mg098_518 [Candidatus Parcubacteria bacterium]|nr:MAG: hypothetical protein KatS3mg098_518 [Candidatus Parcubacteria bacterium]